MTRSSGKDINPLNYRMNSTPMRVILTLEPVSRRLRISPLLAVLTLILVSCEPVSEQSGGSELNLEPDWIVPEHEVIDGGPGQDGIPSIDNPKFVSVEQADFVSDDRRVLGIKFGDEIRAYPHQILDWHEIVNDRFGDIKVAVTYCPLTATGIAWLPRLGSEFGTSGLIFRNNLVAYDRNSGSLWSQMRIRSINGPRMGETLQTVYLIDTLWSTWISMFPNSKVLSDETGFSRDYQSYAYGKEYAEKDGIILFPTKYRKDERLNRKTRVHAIIADDTPEENSPVKVYEIGKFGDGINVVHDTFEGERYAIIGSGSLDFAVAYSATLRDGIELTFEAVQGQLPVIIQDQEGNRWNVFGEAVEGPRTGERLKPAKSYSGYWYGMRDLYRLPDIYRFENP